MKLLDQVAYACASRFSGENVVTLSVDRVIFKHPIPIGSLVTFLASVNYTGRTSCEVGIKVLSEDIKNRTVTHTNSSYFTMVAIDGKTGRPTPMPQLTPESEEEKRRFEDGEKRKAYRLKYK